MKRLTILFVLLSLGCLPSDRVCQTTNITVSSYCPTLEGTTLTYEEYDDRYAILGEMLRCTYNLNGTHQSCADGFMFWTLTEISSDFQQNVLDCKYKHK